LEKHLGYANT